MKFQKQCSNEESNYIPHVTNKTPLVLDQNELLKKMAKGAPLNDLLICLINIVETYAPKKLFGSILLNNGNNELCNGITNSIQREYIDNLTVEIGANSASCGTAAYYKEPVYVSNIETNSKWDKYKKDALKYGFKACWSLPILAAEEELLGTFAFYFKDITEPSREDTSYLSIFTDLASIIISSKQNEDILRKNEEKYKIITENKFDTIVTVNDEGTIEYASPSHQNAFGYKSEELLGKKAFHFIHPEDVPFVQQRFKEMISNNEPRFVTFRFRGRDGKYTPLESKGMPVLNDPGEAKSIVILSHDVSKQVELMNELKKKEQKYSSLFYHNSDGICSIDLNGNILKANPAAQKITGYRIDELEGMPFIQLIEASHTEEALRQFTETLQGSSKKDELMIIKKNGQIKELDVMKVPIYVDDEIVGIYIIAKDITEQKEAKKKIEHMAFFDQVTLLPNRHKFQQDINNLLQKTKQKNGHFLIHYIDLDGFKSINDLLGHSSGDLVLKQVSERLSSCLQDEIKLYRVGGDEFAILSPENNIYDGERTAKRLLEVLAQPLIVKNQEYTVTASIGISMYPVHGNEQDTLVQNADMAMYYSKKNGKNTYQLFNDTIKETNIRSFQLKHHLQQALRKNEFSLFFQPKIHLLTGKVGVEVLIRWNSPQFGFVSPAEFIPIAEEFGYIHLIDDWVLFNACDQFKTWKNQGCDLSHISVNISAKQLEDGTSLVSKVSQLLKDTNINPSCLELEITESTLMEDLNLTIDYLRKLKDLGIKIAIDDFGSHYSSLNYVKRFPVDRIKIDRSFINDILNTKDSEIVKMIISLSHKLGLEVTAEGVEHKEQLQWLKENGCDEVQGFYFSKPISIQCLPNVVTDLLNYNYPKHN